MTQSPGDNQGTPRRPLRLGEILVSRGLLTAAQLEETLNRQHQQPGKLLGEFLVEQKLVAQADVTAALAASLGIPFCRLTERMIAQDAIALLPWSFLEARNILPMNASGDWITVAVADFTNLQLLEEIAAKTGKRVQCVAAVADNLRQVRQAFAPVHQQPAAAQEGPGHDFSDIVDEINEGELSVVEDAPQEEQQTQASLEAAASDSPVVKLVNYLIRKAVERRASDIHIEPNDGECRVRYRIDGDLVEQMRPPFKLLPAVVSRIKIMADMDISERRVPQDGGITVMVQQRAVDLRVSTMPTKWGEKVVIRIIDNNAALLKLDALGFSPGILARLRSTITLRSGIILVTGPTGSGKSTTLYATLAEIVSDKRNVSTIEDPIEYNMKGVNQFQVNKKAGFTFASALRALLRQDPNIIMVGEIRDMETARLATEAALTGHLVFATLHTNDAPSALTRLVNMGVEPYLVAAALRAVLAQRLVRKLCPHCRLQKPVDPAMQALIYQATEAQTDLEFVYTAPGCARCAQTGCSGRVAVHEFLEVDEGLLTSIGHSMDLPALRRLARPRGYQPLLFDGLAKVKEGLISLESLFEVIGRVDDTIQPAQQQQQAA